MKRPVIAVLLAAAAISCGSSGNGIEPGSFEFAYTLEYGADRRLYAAAGYGSSIDWNYEINPGGNVRLVDFSPDGTQAILWTETELEGWGLYLADLTSRTGGTLLKVQQEFPSGGGYLEPVRFSPDGKWILYIACPEVLGWNHLYAVNVETGIPGPPVDLSPELASDEYISSFTVSVLGDVAMEVRRSSGYSSKGLYLARTALSPNPVLLSETARPIAFTPSGNSLLCYDSTLGRVVARAMPFNPSGVMVPAPPNYGIPPPGYGTVRPVAFSPDSSRMFLVGQDYLTVQYLNPVSGLPLHLDTVETPAYINEWIVSRDGQIFIFSTGTDVYTVSIGDIEIGEPVKISSRESDGFPRDLSCSDDGRTILYRSDILPYFGSGPVYVARTGKKHSARSLDSYFLAETGKTLILQGAGLSPEGDRIVAGTHVKGESQSELYWVSVDENIEMSGLEVLGGADGYLVPLKLFEGSSPLLYLLYNDRSLYAELGVADLSTGPPPQSNVLTNAPLSSVFTGLWVEPIAPRYEQHHYGWFDFYYSGSLKRDRRGPYGRPPAVMTMNP